MPTIIRWVLSVVFLIAVTVEPRIALSESSTPLRATLENGLHVVVLRNTLAPVVTVQLNVRVGGDETPPGFPGMAHAQEHMAFRGCEGMSADQTAAIYALMGADNNADTQQTITQYFATVPKADLGVALQAQAACLRGIDDSQTQWAAERGAIEQEVARDLSNPTYNFITRLNEDLFAGSPYAHDALGTKASFEGTSGEMLEAFYRRWYAPSNAILVIVGDVDPAATLDSVRQLFGSIADHALPKRSAVQLRPVHAEKFTLKSNLPYLLSFVAFRLPGTDSPDYAAARILAAVLNSPRGEVYAMVPAGHALASEFGLAEAYPKASVGFGVLALPAGSKAVAPLEEMRRILARYAQAGVPAGLVTAAKYAALADAAFEQTSIPGLANLWSNALAAEGRDSPDTDMAAIDRVTPADVNRVAKQYLRIDRSVTGILEPVPTGEPVASKGFGGAEQLAAAPTKPVALPDWAQEALSRLQVATETGQITDLKLPNGVRLIVKTDSTSPTVSLLGAVRTDPDLQTPAGKEGVADVLNELFSYGTQSLDRIAFQKALDDIGAKESAGVQFAVAALKDQFPRAVSLLADNELHPSLPPAAFNVVKQQVAQFVAGNLKSPDYRATRALDGALLPARDPALREVAPETVSALTLEDIHQYYAATIRPDLTTIVVIGDISAQQAQAVVEGAFASWRSVGPVPQTVPAAVPSNQASAVQVADPQAVQDSVVLAEQLASNRFDPDYYALQLGSHVLGGGFYATRLYHDLRQVAGYVYNVDVRLEADQTRSRFVLTYGCDPDNVAKARALAERDLNQMRTEPVSPEELHQAKATLLRQMPLQESSQEAVATGLLARAQLGLPLDEPSIAARRYAALSADEVKTAFAKAIHPDRWVQVVRGPQAH